MTRPSPVTHGLGAANDGDGDDDAELVVMSLPEGTELYRRDVPSSILLSHNASNDQAETLTNATYVVENAFGEDDALVGICAYRVHETVPRKRFQVCRR